MKEQIKTPEKEVSDKERENLSVAECKTLIMRMLTELIELGDKVKEEMKATQSEIKENIQGTNSEGKETRTQINDLEQKDPSKHQLEQNEETRMQKNAFFWRGLETSGTTLSIPTSKSWECQKKRKSKISKT